MGAQVLYLRLLVTLRPSLSVTTILTVKRPLGSPRRSTGAVIRFPERVATRLPSTLTVALLSLKPLGCFSRMRKLRRLTHCFDDG